MPLNNFPQLFSKDINAQEVSSAVSAAITFLQRQGFDSAFDKFYKTTFKDSKGLTQEPALPRRSHYCLPRGLRNLSAALPRCLQSDFEKIQFVKYLTFAGFPKQCYVKWIDWAHLPDNSIDFCYCRKVIFIFTAYQVIFTFNYDTKALISPSTTTYSSSTY